VSIMRHFSLAAVVGLALAVPAVGGKPGAKPADKAAEGATCGSYGTTIEFVDTPKEAAVQAKKENKLVFVLHVSGNFEDPRFT
jgi:hypothetical protein